MITTAPALEARPIRSSVRRGGSATASFSGRAGAHANSWRISTTWPACSNAFCAPRSALSSAARSECGSVIHASRALRVRAGGRGAVRSREMRPRLAAARDERCALDGCILASKCRQRAESRARMRWRPRYLGACTRMNALRLRHTWPLRTNKIRRRSRRTNHSPNRPHRPASRNSSRQRTNRRLTRRNSRPSN